MGLLYPIPNNSNIFIVIFVRHKRKSDCLGVHLLLCFEGVPFFVFFLWNSHQVISEVDIEAGIRQYFKIAKFDSYFFPFESFGYDYVQFDGILFDFLFTHEQSFLLFGHRLSGIVDWVVKVLNFFRETHGIKSSLEAGINKKIVPVAAAKG